MTNRPRNPQPDPSPVSKEPRGDQAQKPAAPGVSFYFPVFTSAARKKLVSAQEIQHPDPEIGILRMRLKDLLHEELTDKNCDNTPRILKTIELIVRAYAAKNRVSKDSPEDAAEGIATVIKDISLELGMDLIPGKTNA